MSKSNPSVQVIDQTAQMSQSNPSVQGIEQTAQKLKSNPPAQVIDQGYRLTHLETLGTITEP